MIRAAWIAAASLIATVAIAETITRGTDDSIVGPAAPSIGHSSAKMLCSQHECRVVTKPTGDVVTECACDIATQVAKDYCNNAANGIPCLNATGRLPSSVMPDGGAPPVVVFPNATKTITGTQTVLLTELGAIASAALAHTVGCTATYHTGTGTGTETDTATGTAWGIGKDPTVTCTGTATSMPSPMPVVCPVGATCAGKTATDTTTSTATGTGGTTFYATAAQPVSATVASTYTLPVAGTTTTTGTNTATLGGVKVGPGLTLASDGTVSPTYGTTAGTVVQGNDSRVANAANQQLSNLSGTVAINKSLLAGSSLLNLGSLSVPWLTAYVNTGMFYSVHILGGVAGEITISVPSTVTNYALSLPGTGAVGCLYRNVDGTSSWDSACHYTLPIASGSILGGVKIGSGVTVSGDGTISVTPAGIGADPAGVATTAVNAAVTGTPGGLAYFASAHALASTVGATATPTPSAIPVSDGSGKLNAWVSMANKSVSFATNGGSVAANPTEATINTITFPAASGDRLSVMAIARATETTGGTCSLKIYLDGSLIGLSDGAGQTSASPSGLISLTNIDEVFGLSAANHTVISTIGSTEGSSCVVGSGNSRLIVSTTTQ